MKGRGVKNEHGGGVKMKNSITSQSPFVFVAGEGLCLWSGRHFKWKMKHIEK
jgi:hypothetical protein